MTPLKYSYFVIVLEYLGYRPLLLEIKEPSGYVLYTLQVSGSLISNWVSVSGEISNSSVGFPDIMGPSPRLLHPQSYGGSIHSYSEMASFSGLGSGQPTVHPISHRGWWTCESTQWPDDPELTSTHKTRRHEVIWNTRPVWKLEKILFYIMAINKAWRGHRETSD